MPSWSDSNPHVGSVQPGPGEGWREEAVRVQLARGEPAQQEDPRG